MKYLLRKDSRAIAQATVLCILAVRKCLVGGDIEVSSVFKRFEQLYNEEHGFTTRELLDMFAIGISSLSLIMNALVYIVLFWLIGCGDCYIFFRTDCM